eukprot:1192828-Pleurochrysis_carterae.AAC.5
MANCCGGLPSFADARPYKNELRYVYFVLTTCAPPLEGRSSDIVQLVGQVKQVVPNSIMVAMRGIVSYSHEGLRQDTGRRAW